MQINYHDWFLKYHQYLTGSRDGVTSYNDTKWVNMNKRLETLINLNSELIQNQPYNVVGNYTAFKRLMDLMEKSNYTFEDMDQSLIKTYKMSLQNAMSSMVVNTHAVIAHYYASDKKHVYHGSTDHYYIIDVPFDQLHFGDRDEFIRQRLHEFHETENDYYVNSDRFLSKYISDILGFTVLCTVNGFITNDWKVAIDEKGFRFKIGWSRVEQAEFIIYKLDKTFTMDIELTKAQIADLSQTHYISSYDLGIENNPELVGARCIYHICDNSARNDIQITPNFGLIKENGLDATMLQSRTMQDINATTSDKIRLRLYIIKYIFELPDIYPMLDFYDLITRKHVYDDLGNRITTTDGKYVISEYKEDQGRNSTICSPPIIVDRYDDCVMDSLTKCAYISDKLNAEVDLVDELYSKLIVLTSSNYRSKINDLRESVNLFHEHMLSVYEDYLHICITTNLVDEKTRNVFDDFITRLNTFVDAVNDQTVSTKVAYQNINSTWPDEISEDAVAYINFVRVVAEPFMTTTFNSIRSVLNGAYGVGFFFKPETSDDMWHHDHGIDENSAYAMIANRINRPISEQCFIALTYDYTEACWKFACPTINHFKGISNTFYIRDSYEENSIFKFFILYTDTENPKEKRISPFEYEQLCDYDKFMDEVDAHMGYVKYWDVESRLMKLSRMMYGANGHQQSIAILSRILARKMKSDWMTEYPSLMNYEMSNASSDNVGAGEYDIRAPFALNFMFYTISMLYDNKDELQAYFLRQLIGRQFHPRYSDLRINQLAINKLPAEHVNYSVISKSPSTISSLDKSKSNLPDIETCSVYSGFPYVLDSNFDITHLTNDTEYPYTFNQYWASEHHPYISNIGMDSYYYLRFSNPLNNGMKQIWYYDDAHVAAMMSVCVSELMEIVNQVQTNYESIWDQAHAFESAIATIDKYGTKIMEYVQSSSAQFHYVSTVGNPGTMSIATRWFNPSSNNGLRKIFSDILTRLKRARQFGGQFTDTPEQLAQTILTKLRFGYQTRGYSYYLSRYARAAYILLKKINEPMSLHELQQWILDVERLDHGKDTRFDDTEGNLDTLINSLDNQQQAIFKNDIVRLRVALYYENGNSLLQIARDLVQMYQFTDWWSLFMPEIMNYFTRLVTDYTFGIFAIDDIQYDDSYATINSGDPVPEFALLRMATDDPHVIVPDETPISSEFVTLLFKPMYDNGKLVALYPICNYSFFDGTSIVVDGTDYTFEFYYSDGTQSSIDGTGLTFTFKKVSSSADRFSAHMQLVGCQTIPLEIQNIHEEFNVQQDGTILNERHASLNYELLVGNRFMPLSYDSEFVVTQHSGPYDKLHLRCDQINRYAVTDRSGQPSSTWYFKPCQVAHLPIDQNGYMYPLGGGYFEGQTVYAYTDDGLCVFPMIVTSVDHCEAQGAVELKVDEHRATWFRATDPEVIEKYLNADTGITCTIVDDNIRNFLDEYTNYTGPYYPIPQVSSTTPIPGDWNDVYTLPGDPIYVVNNSDYVYTRLNWLFHDEIPNRIDDNIDPMQHFVYLGDIMIHELSPTGELHLLFHDFNQYTLPSMYPVLREEPDDHDIWNAEHSTFNSEIERVKQEVLPTLYNDLNGLNAHLMQLLAPVLAVDSLVMINQGTMSDGHYIPTEHLERVWVVNAIDQEHRTVQLIDTDEPFEYQLVTEEPVDWETSYRNYYHQDYRGNFVKITSLTPPVWGSEDFYRYIHIKLQTPYVLSFDDVRQIQRDIYKKKRDIQLQIEAVNREIEYYNAYIKRLQLYDAELETPTKWYNVNSYDAAMVYINNGRAKPLMMHKTVLRDIVSGDATIWLYDWEHKYWINPSEYLVSKIGYNSGYDVHDDYKTSIVKERLQISFLDPTVSSKKILVYVAYDTSDKWDRINLGSMDCQVFFKPVLALNPDKDYSDIYSRIRVRKHYDESETYRIAQLDPPPSDFPITDGFMFTRPERSGKYKYASPIRFCDMKVIMNDDTELTFSDFDIFVRNPLLDANVPMYHVEPNYNVSIGLPIDGFEPDHHILLVSVRNDNVSKFNGVSSNIMFDAITGLDDEDQPIITITSSTIPNGITGTFVCTVIPDGTSPMSGGLVNVMFSETRTPSPLAETKYQIRSAMISDPGSGYTHNYVRLMLQDSTLSNEIFEVIGDDEGHAVSIRNIFNDGSKPGTYPYGPDGSNVDADYETSGNWEGSGISVVPIDGSMSFGLTVDIQATGIQTIEQYQKTNWVHLFHDENNVDVAYKIIPEQVILVPKTPLDIINIRCVSLKNQYVLDSDGSDDIKDGEIDAPFTYYYDTKHHVRYPISDVRRNDPDKRLVIDTTVSTDVSTIRSNHISVCRYASHTIPQDGIIDLTGYIPTPLSRERYEFWVNGKYVDDPDVVILSPTSFQLRNMTSLHNLEVIELVDDISDSELLPKGPVYVDLNGNTYGSYHSMLIYKANLFDQSIKYVFNQSTKQGIDDWIDTEHRASGNRDYEPDILSYVQIDEETSNDYRELYHIPTINGQTIFHATTQSLGFLEITNHQVIQELDRVWKKEILNGVIPITHNGKLDLQSNAVQFLHVIKRDDEYEIYTTGTFDRPFTLYISTTQNGQIQNAATTIKIMPMLRAGTHVILSTDFEDQWLLSTVPNTKPVKIK